MSPPRVDSIALALCGAGVTLHLYTVAFRAENGPSLFLAGLLFWSCTPYVVAAAFTRFQRTKALAFGMAVACLAADAVMHYSVFIAPRGSTAALGLLFMPLWNLFAVGPLGALLAWSVIAIHGRRANAP